MPSNLRFSTTVDSTPAVSEIRRSPSPLAKKQKMSLSQTYMVASTARAKLGKEAMRPDHNLRRLVGHANLLDNLMVELRDAEREQDAWFNASVRKASREEEQPSNKHIRWADTIVEEDDMETDSDDDDDSEADDAEFDIPIPARLRQTPVTISSADFSEDAIMEDEDEDEMGYMDFDDSPELALVRTESHPPELVDDASDSEDEASPKTPPQAVLDFSEKDILALTMPHKQSSSMPALPERHVQHVHAPLIAAY